MWNRNLTGLAACVLLACCGSQQQRRPFEQAARDYVFAWCRGDGSHAAMEFAAVPAAFGEFGSGLHTDLQLEQRAGIEEFAVTGLEFVGPGKSKTLAGLTFGYESEAMQTSGTVFVRVRFSARLNDGVQRTGQVAVRPDVSFTDGAHQVVGPEVTWKVIPAPGR